MLNSFNFIKSCAIFAVICTTFLGDLNSSNSYSQSYSQNFNIDLITTPPTQPDGYIDAVYLNSKSVYRQNLYNFKESMDKFLEGTDDSYTKAKVLKSHIPALTRTLEKWLKDCSKKAGQKGFTPSKRSLAFLEFISNAKTEDNFIFLGPLTEVLTENLKDFKDLTEYQNLSSFLNMVQQVCINISIYDSKWLLTSTGKHVPPHSFLNHHTIKIADNLLNYLWQNPTLIPDEAQPFYKSLKKLIQKESNPDESINILIVQEETEKKLFLILEQLHKALQNIDVQPLKLLNSEIGKLINLHNTAKSQLNSYITDSEFDTYNVESREYMEYLDDFRMGMRMILSSPMDENGAIKEMKNMLAILSTELKNWIGYYSEKGTNYTNKMELGTFLESISELLKHSCNKIMSDLEVVQFCSSIEYLKTFKEVSENKDLNALLDLIQEVCLNISIYDDKGLADGKVLPHAVLTYHTVNDAKNLISQLNSNKKKLKEKIKIQCENVNIKIPQQNRSTPPLPFTAKQCQVPTFQDFNSLEKRSDFLSALGDLCEMLRQDIEQCQKDHNNSVVGYLSPLIDKILTSIAAHNKDNGKRISADVIKSSNSKDRFVPKVYIEAFDKDIKTILTDENVERKVKSLKNKLYFLTRGLMQWLKNCDIMQYPHYFSQISIERLERFNRELDDLEDAAIAINCALYKDVPSALKTFSMISDKIMEKYIIDLYDCVRSFSWRVKDHTSKNKEFCRPVPSENDFLDNWLDLIQKVCLKISTYDNKSYRDKNSFHNFPHGLIVRHTVALAEEALLTMRKFTNELLGESTSHLCAEIKNFCDNNSHLSTNDAVNLITLLKKLNNDTLKNLYDSESRKFDEESKLLKQSESSEEEKRIALMKEETRLLESDSVSLADLRKYSQMFRDPIKEKKDALLSMYKLISDIAELPEGLK